MSFNFTRAMIAHLNKIWRVWAWARAIARHSQPGLIHANLMEMYQCRSRENVYMHISWKCIHAYLMEMYTCQCHANVYTQISWKFVHANLIEMDTWKSHPDG